jgi:hypothetical protein
MESRENLMQRLVSNLNQMENEQLLDSVDTLMRQMSKLSELIDNKTVDESDADYFVVVFYNFINDLTMYTEFMNNEVDKHNPISDNTRAVHNVLYYGNLSGSLELVRRYINQMQKKYYLKSRLDSKNAQSFIAVADIAIRIEELLELIDDILYYDRDSNPLDPLILNDVSSLLDQLETTDN